MGSKPWRACSNGKRDGTMLQVLLCRGWKKRDVLAPPRCPVGGGDKWGLPEGNPPAFAAPGCTILEVSAGSGVCCPMAVGVFGGWPPLRPLCPTLRVMLGEAGGEGGCRGGWRAMATWEPLSLSPAVSLPQVPGSPPPPFGTVTVMFATGASLGDPWQLLLPPPAAWEGLWPPGRGVLGGPASSLPVSLPALPSLCSQLWGRRWDLWGQPLLSAPPLPRQVLGCGSGIGRWCGGFPPPRGAKCGWGHPQPDLVQVSHCQPSSPSASPAGMPGARLSLPGAF